MVAFTAHLKAHAGETPSWRTGGYSNMPLQRDPADRLSDNLRTTRTAEYLQHADARNFLTAIHDLRTALNSLEVAARATYYGAVDDGYETQVYGVHSDSDEDA